ncbi:Ankyrin repeat-containing domain [Phytophthora cactorum]|nr:Ankyrin repeat-containing domain [Phytophthora cactorum]
MVSTRTPLLTCVSVVWRERQESLGFLPHVAALISATGSAAEHGQLEVVKWLDKTIPDLQASTKAMDLAAAHGHLEVVQWLHDNRSEGCSHHAIDEAGARGHVDVVEWLAAHRDEGGPSTR